MKTILRTATLTIWSLAAGLGIGACTHAPVHTQTSSTCSYSDWGNTRQVGTQFQICQPNVYPAPRGAFSWQPLPGRQMAS